MAPLRRGLSSFGALRGDERLHLGYREATLLADGPLGRAGDRLRGHEFHYATVVDPGRDRPLARVADAEGTDLRLAGSRRDRVTGSFFHLIAAAPGRDRTASAVGPVGAGGSGPEQWPGALVACGTGGAAWLLVPNTRAWPRPAKGGGMT